MSKYLESIESEEAVTGLYNQKVPESAVVLDVSADIPLMTYVEQPTYDKPIGQDTVSYSAPQKVIVRTYRLRK